jgi:hypothetical protein
MTSDKRRDVIAWTSLHVTTDKQKGKHQHPAG